MEEFNKNNLNLDEKTSQILFDHWTNIYSQENNPSDFFNGLEQTLHDIFFEKIEINCRNILQKGYKQWAYNKYRIDLNGSDGVNNLAADVYIYLLESSDKEKFVNLKEVFKNGHQNINRNISGAVKRVLAQNREITVIDRLLRRIENIADNDDNNITRHRIEEYGPKADFFTLVDKFPEKRDPTNEEIEKVISLVGHFEESKPNKNMKQAPRIYKTEQLVEMMEIICENLPTDVTPNTLETIFIDLVPDFLPHEFLIEKAFKIYGDVKFPIDTNMEPNLDEIEASKRVLIIEEVERCIKKIDDFGIRKQTEIIKDHLTNKDLKINTLVKEKEFSSREDVEKVLQKIGIIANELFATIDDEFLAETAFSYLIEKI